MAEEVELSHRIQQLRDLDEARLQAAISLSESHVEPNDANAMYQRCFQMLKLGSLEAEMPRLVVFGQQSMGKTTLLDMIMGGPIGYSSTDTGTKQPIVIMLKPNEDVMNNALGDDNIICTLAGQPIKIQDLHKEMHKRMAQAQTISSEELELQMAVPGGVHAVFVDLPGIKDDSKEGAELTRTVVRTYVQNNPNDLYILVKKASDDPANWPYSLREFILSKKPQGLGLTPKQTIVVGTRALDFLKGERNDIRTLSQLKERVLKRAVCDHEGRPLPLHLLELFSLTMADKESSNFQERKRKMDEQIAVGRRKCRENLEKCFQPDSVRVEDLAPTFDVDHFSKELNAKFQTLLTDQLSILEQRLMRKKRELLHDTRTDEVQLLNRDSATVRESIQAFVTALGNLSTDLISGNFEVLRLDDGDKWLAEFGGTLADNLKDGHELAIDMFYPQQKYTKEFLAKTEERADLAIRKLMQRKTNEKTTKAKIMEKMRLKKKKPEEGADAEAVPEAEEPSDGTYVVVKVNMPCPNRSGNLEAGQFIRFTAKDGTQMVGYVRSLEKSKAVVVFSWRQNPNQPDQEQPRDITDLSKLEVMLPLGMLISPTLQPVPFLAWHQTYRTDNWKGVEPVWVTSISKDLQPEASPWISDTQDVSGLSTMYMGIAEIVPPGPGEYKTWAALMKINKDIDGVHPGAAPAIPNTQRLTVTTAELFVDVEVVNDEDSVWNKITPLQRIAGEFAETKLLNQLSLTYLGRWLKFHIAHMEPNRRLSDNILLQMMRGVKHVVDKADWEPVVADLLQINIRGDLLPLVRLAACATSVALRRILLAAFHELKRKINGGETSSAWSFLIKSPRFVVECETALEQYCRNRAQICSDELEHIILDQTYAIHFESASDIFNGCRQFEADFLGTSSLENVAEDVSKRLLLRKQELGQADVYAHGAKALQSQSMIYEEVRVHFWVAKTLLSAPITSKLYVIFIKDIKDRSHHLGADMKRVNNTQNLENTLLTQFFNDGDVTEELRQRTEEELLEYYRFNIDTKEIKNRIEGYRKVTEYIKLALDCVSALRNLMSAGRHVDFLRRLGGHSTPEFPSRVPVSTMPVPTASVSTIPSPAMPSSAMPSSAMHMRSPTPQQTLVTQSPPYPRIGQPVAVHTMPTYQTRTYGGWDTSKS
eukprot:Blabericola_migrator_1__898@NODE_1220_length_5067_cov_124_045200_g299_i1_p1_GENE_NODE_1220_length_5067_cov_124_045200_g299_i1NODE_1220_length_5067_cov_124_045200_g299_i1_p1_ORF_typecomplete_len1161_score249_11Dynamin_N/PF00350_23/1_3e16Dynamin_N/PF00350_23/7_3e03Dynamin_N/PF00350_23/1_1e04MMR_HSR1/PF01926_23/6e05MSA2c/PF12238_8/0_0066AIG1/PF04548_16/0_036FeoB_N/PF02421_18/1_1e02FeoB_N/PF02421_18/0_46AAA_15/PF13175_6/1_9AAA_15/PF13175_6/2_8e02TniB/PF05621_11/0_26TniB/PF05621_11/7_5e03GTP_EFTU/PF0